MFFFYEFKERFDHNRTIIAVEGRLLISNCDRLPYPYFRTKSKTIDFQIFTIPSCHTFDGKMVAGEVCLFKIMSSFLQNKASPNYSVFKIVNSHGFAKPLPLDTML
jgi:hypothetical protein